MLKGSKTKHVFAALGLLILLAALGGYADSAKDRGPLHSHPHRLRTAPPALTTSRTKPQAPLASPKVKTSALRMTQPTVTARLLVLSADGKEACLPAIRQVLDYLGTPYTVYVASQTPGGLTADKLSNGVTGYYQGIILATGNLAWLNGMTWTPALTETEWTTLANYEASFKVRQVSWYTYPTTATPFSGQVSEQDTTTTPLAATLTPAGAQVFSYLNAANPLTLRNSYTYLSPAAPSNANSTNTVLLADAQGNALALITASPDGRENLAFTFDNAPFLVHSVALSYGAINWVTRGLFLGYRRVFLSAQVDDLFLSDDMYTGGTFRITGDDFKLVDAWQTNLQNTDPLMRGWRVDMAFNGEGTTSTYAPNDTLLPMAKQLQADFKWISHTYTHPDLDVADYASTVTELTKNNDAAVTQGFTGYSAAVLVTPNVSGLYNTNAMQAMKDRGVRYVVSDTSKPIEANPTPNTGIYNALQPTVFEVPRRPTNLFYNVSTPDEWVAEYNALYRAYWGRDLTYPEILDKESDMILMYMLRGENDPLMFHQPNLRAYDGQHSLMGDLIDLVLAKYHALYTLPVVSPTFQDLGDVVWNQTRYLAAGVTATITGDTLSLSTQQDVVVPVTGLRTADAASYAGETTAFVTLGAGQSITLTQPPQQ